MNFMVERMFGKDVKACSFLFDSQLLTIVLKKKKKTSALSSLTLTLQSVSSEAVHAHAGIASYGVCTRCVAMTPVSSFLTLVDVFKLKTKTKQGFQSFSQQQRKTSEVVRSVKMQNVVGNS